MSYEEFLFCQLLQVQVEHYRELEYDLLYEQVPALYKKFKDSNYNKSTVWLYECIEKYLENEDVWYD